MLFQLWVRSRVSFSAIVPPEMSDLVLLKLVWKDCGTLPKGPRLSERMHGCFDNYESWEAYTIFLLDVEWIPFAVLGSNYSP